MDPVPEGDNSGVQGPDGGQKLWNTNMQGRVEVLVLKSFHISDRTNELSTIPKFLMVLVTNLCN